MVQGNLRTHFEGINVYNTPESLALKNNIRKQLIEANFEISERYVVREYF